LKANSCDGINESQTIPNFAVLEEKGQGKEGERLINFPIKLAALSFP